MDNDIINIKNEGELSLMMYYLDPVFINSIIDMNFNNKDNPYTSGSPNLVSAINTVIDAKLSQELIDEDEAKHQKNIIFNNIITNVCSKYYLNPIFGNNSYEGAYFIYSFFISNYRQNILKFFVNTILREKNSLYNSVSSIEDKRKDSSYLYGKKLYNDQKLAIINSNLEEVISRLCTLEFSLKDIISIVLFNGIENSKFSYLITDIVQDNDNFFEFYKESIKNNLPRYMCDIRLLIHQIAIK